MTDSSEAPNYPALVIDGSSARFFAGVLGTEDRWLALKTADEPALESLFATVDEVLDQADCKLGNIRSYIYCEGPGSVLGLRLCAMAIETWQRIHPVPAAYFSYNSLKLAAAQLCGDGSLAETSLLISDWKKDRWNSVQFDREGIGEVRPIDTGTLSRWSGPLYHLPARKGWQRPPETAQEITYAPECLASQCRLPGLIQARGCVELYSSGVNTFQKWIPQRHGAEIRPGRQEETKPDPAGTS